MARNPGVGRPAVRGERRRRSRDVRGRPVHEVSAADLAVALHDFSDLEAGTVGTISGYMLAGATSVDVTIRGRGGHGAYPQLTKDPIVMSAEFIMALQTIVSRENRADRSRRRNGGFDSRRHEIQRHSGRRPFAVHHPPFKPEVRQHILDALARIANGIATPAGGVPADRAPIVKVNESEKADPIYNDPALTSRVSSVAAERARG